MEAQLSKESLLKQVDSLRAQARRARRLSENLNDSDDKQRLSRHAVELDQDANRLEKQAADAKAWVVAPAIGRVIGR